MKCEEDSKPVLPPAIAIFPRTDASPSFVNDQPKAVQCPPKNEIPTRTVPQATEQHGDHEIDIGAESSTELWECDEAGSNEQSAAERN